MAEDKQEVSKTPTPPKDIGKPEQGEGTQAVPPKAPQPSKPTGAGGTGPAGVKQAVAGAAAEAAVDKAVGDKLSAGQKRFVTAAARGAVEGAMTGGNPASAGVGAAKEAGLDAAQQAKEKKDAKDGVGSDGSPTKTDGKDGSEAPSPEQRLGAGGTGYERGKRPGDDPETTSGSGGSDGSGMGKRAAVAGAAVATPPAAGLTLLIMFLNWLKSFFFSVIAQMLSLLAMMIQWLLGAGTAMWNFMTKPFVAMGAAVAKALTAVTGGAVAVTTTVAAVGVAALSGFSILGLIVGMFGFLGTSFAAQEDPTTTQNCRVIVGNQEPGGETGPVDANVERNALAVYSVFKTWGMPDENIAGILGNWTQESGVDPTSVEGIYDEPYQIGPRKQSAWDGGFSHMGYVDRSGIGLGQWTNSRNQLLIDYAERVGGDWHNIGVQLRFMADSTGDNPSDVEVFKGMLTTSLGSPAAAALHFHDKWERSADGATGLAERERDAEMWFAKMSGWTVDQGLVDQIVGDFVVGGGGMLPTGPRPAQCSDQDGSTGGVAPQNGGMTQEEAQKLIDLYNQEGDAFLDRRYGPNGGPGSCGSNHAMNCVSFSTYFVNKYTTYQSYPMGHGYKTAYTIAAETGKQMSTTPTPYSVGSGPSSSQYGHTLVVLGVNGDQVILGEAGWCAYMGRIRIDSAAAMAAEGWQFVPMADAMLPPDQIKTQ